MIHYHGGPITPNDAALRVWSGRHAFVSYAYPDQIPIAAEYCQSFALDNGAFTAWKSGKVVDWTKYYSWSELWLKHPGCDWAVIPDVIGGSEKDNNKLLEEWPHGIFKGVPVWHLHESLERLEELTTFWPRLAFGSSGEYATPGTNPWWLRINDALRVVCDKDGLPKVKLHGLRMLNHRIFSKIPFSSCDSTNVARNIGIDKSFTKEPFKSASKAIRGLALASRIESFNSSSTWCTRL